MKRKLISFDWAIKKILRSKANFGILEGFLSELLFNDIKIIEILESESNQETERNKCNRVDIKVRDNNNQIILIEVQYSRELDFLFRILFETSKSISEHLEEGLAYSNVVKIISINILYFDFCQGNDYIYHGTTSFIGLHNKTMLQLNESQKKLFKLEKIADIFPEFYIINIKNFDNQARDTLDEWIYFLKNEEIEDNFQAKGLKEAKEKLNVLKMNSSEKLAYEQYQKTLHRESSLYESTYILGKSEGKVEGKEEEKREIAKKGKQEGIPIKVLTLMTGLSKDEIENL
ncbi:MAG: Rpn family recombination-promoting nuclease/putative transposase [Thiomargarita sp.]|nr:Rpn family recombination-promoting nuclease/putative transposase [Bacteroidales bacterium]MCK5718715.1 Rpn family recombination-promoting nuclease/putative transposase [Thiomargarita sp.]